MVTHEYGARLAETIAQLRQRFPPVRFKGRKSLESTARARLLSVADPSSPENPWTDPFVRLRNWVIINWLLGTGMRKGELLGMLVRDFDRREGYCEIRRRQDNKRDPRRKEARAKTLERLAPLDERLTQLGEQYLASRNGIQSALRHGFLFVATSGKPLSANAITEMFSTLRKKYPEIGPACAHVLRHQWNEDFSIYADAVRMKPDEEVAERCWLMGWSPTSKMPAHYLKRKTKAKADEHSRDMQRRMVKHGPEIKRRIEDASSVA